MISLDDGSIVGHSVMELKTLILEAFDPVAIEQEVRQTTRKRQLLIRWGEATGVQWAYSPKFDAENNASARYLPEGNKNSVPSGAVGFWGNESAL